MTNAHGTFIWYELLTTDPDAATDFYSKVVGWQARGARQPGMDYRLWSIGDVDVGGSWVLRCARQPSPKRLKE